MSSQVTPEVETVSNAIDQARSAARAAGLRVGDADGINDEQVRNVSYAFELSGVKSAPDVGAVEDALEAVPGVRAHIVYSTSMAWITAPETVGPDHLTRIMSEFGVEAVLTDSSLRRRMIAAKRQNAMEKNVAKSKARNLSGRARRHLMDEGRALEQARKSGFFDEDWHSTQQDDVTASEVLYTAGELISARRLVLAVILCIPVLALNYVTALQFSSWQWACLLLSTPVVTFCAWPFHRALVRGVRRGLPALDGASSLAIIVAYVWSLAAMLFTDVGDPGWTSRPSWFAFEQRTFVDGELFFDVACVMTVLLLAGRLFAMRTRSNLLAELESSRPDPHVEVTVVPSKRNGAAPPRTAERVPLNEVNVGDDLTVEKGQVIPVDGVVIGGTCVAEPGAVSAGVGLGNVKVGAQVFSGTRNLHGRIKVRVERTGHRTSVAAIRRWVEEANRRQNHASLLATRTASFLVPTAVVVAFIDFCLWYLIGQNLNAAVASALAILASAAPAALALSPALAIGHGIEAAARSGVLIRDGATLRALDEIDTAVFNRLGTLTTNHMTLDNVVAAHGENPELIIRVAAAMMMESDHPASQAVVKAARASRDRDSDEDGVPHWIEVTRSTINADGSFSGVAELPIPDDHGGIMPRQVEVLLWRPRSMSELHGRLAEAVISAGAPIVVRWQGIDRGVISLNDTVREDADEGVAALEEQGIETTMISRDTYPVARRFADRIGVTNVLAGVAPGGKTKVVRALHTHGARVALIGDETLMSSMKVVDVGILMGSTESLERVVRENEQGVKVVVLPNSVRAIARLIAHSRRVCRIIDRNFLFSWIYTVLTVVASVAGILNPMVATLLMVSSSLIIEARSASAKHFPS